ncbi:MAG: hypothetical protein ACRDOO_24515 [Actinomadura sp.]
MSSAFEALVKLHRDLGTMNTEDAVRRFAAIMNEYVARTRYIEGAEAGRIESDGQDQ